MLSSHLVRRTSLYSTALAIALFAAVGLADSVVTDPVGFTTTSLVSTSATLVATPFTRPQSFVGTVASARGTS